MKLKYKVLASIMSLSIASISLSNSYALTYRNFKNLNLDLPSVIAMDEKSGDILYAQNENEVRPIASLTKSMTFLLSLEALERGDIKEDELITLTETPDSWGSRFYLEKGDSYTVEEYLKMIMVISANDACIVMAEKISGSVDEFVKLMNQKAKELGMDSTIFYNPNGLPLTGNDEANAGNTSTAKDLAILTKYIMNVYGDIATKYVSTRSIEGKEADSIRYNSNKLLLRNNSDTGYTVTGFKTGFTDEAGFCLITTSTHDNSTVNLKDDDFNIITVSLGSTNSEARFTAHSKLLTYVNDTYENKKILDRSSSVGILDEYNSDKYKVTAIANKDVYVLANKESNLEFERTINYKDDLSYPISAGDTIGTLTLKSSSNPELNTSVELVSANSTEKVSILDRIFKRIK